jgi:hypothetical protein
VVLRFILAGLLIGSASYSQTRVLVVGGQRSLQERRAPSPQPPFRFLSEEEEGRSPKVMVRDGRGAVWQVKFGNEVKAEVFATQLAAALGFYADVTHYVASGRILGARGLKSTAEHIDAGGRFQSACFEYRDPSLRFLKDASWTWKENPFAGTRELDGLKTLVMLLSNWDNKDASNSSSNTGILERRAGSRREWIYYVTDWGGSMGKWGRKFFHNKWDCEGFFEQSEDFIKEAKADGEVEFGFRTGNHGGAFKDEITVRDLRWVLKRLNGVTDAQLHNALRQSGATAHEAEHFAAALRIRIRQIERAASGASAKL